MSTEQQHQHQHQCHNFTCRECVRKSTPSFPPNISELVLSLNNRGCMMVTMGKFSKANHLFETALTKHREMTSASNDTSRASEDRNHGALAMRTSHADNDNDVTMVDACDDLDGNDHNGYVTSDSFSDDDDDLDCEYQDGYDTSDSFFDYDDEDYDYNDDNDHERLFPTTVSGSPRQHQPTSTSIRRMSSCSLLQTISYSGQQANRPADKWMHHQIYSLPIVMNQTEWENSPLYDRSFVLIFNSAISYHLLGMQQLLIHQQTQAAGSSCSSSCCSGFTSKLPGNKQHLEVARMLYRLAMEAYKGAVAFESERIFLGVDRLCFPAIFNNLSHVCKTLEGNGSPDAYRYDIFLIRSVYWIIHGTTPPSPSPNNNSRSNAPVTTPRATTLTSNGAAAAANLPELNDCYGDDDAEVLDAFLENVFYLVGAPPSVAPASAA